MAASALLVGCSGKEGAEKAEDFPYSVEKFADLEILRYRVDGFEKLAPKQKELLYYLSEAALQGRDILFDQNGRYNLPIRKTLEAVYANYGGDRATPDFKALELYLKRVWFANGIHHHYSADKFQPGFSEAFFREAVKSVPVEFLPLRESETVDALLDELSPVMFDPSVMPKRINQADGHDLLATSASNYYRDVTQQEAERFYKALKNPADSTPVSYGLNSRLVKEDGKLREKVWKVGGLYGPALERVVYWLEKAAAVAENDAQRAVIEKLVAFNRSGDLKAFDEYAILWLQDTASTVDFVNGFTETYGDPLGLKASWESLVNFRNEEASERTETISKNAQWFEDHSPVDPRFRKERVKGVSAKVINAVMLGGDCYPATPIGINLPNSNWIRHDYGSKSVTIENITDAYDKASQGNGFLEEFVPGETERELIRKYGFAADNMHTDLHECLGHGSGKLLPGTDPDGLKAYGATLEEGRADLFALYYIADPKVMELGLLPDPDAYKAEYYRYLMNGLMTQLVRIEPGKEIEESHMRDRQMIARWVLAQGEPAGILKLEKKDGKTSLVVNDYTGVRRLFGELLREVQRIKSEGDYAAGKTLVETYGVKVDPELHAEIRERYAGLQVAPYKGFVNPRYQPVCDSEGNLVDVKVSYSEGYAEQMMRYSADYATLPAYND